MSYRPISSGPIFQPRPHVSLKLKSGGNEPKLQWEVSAINTLHSLPEIENRKIVTVYYAPVNHDDHMLASGKTTFSATSDNHILSSNNLGIEFSGRDNLGRRVMGVALSGAMASSVVVEEHQILPVPDTWSLLEASTVPVAYLNAYYALVIEGKIKTGETVLINSDTDSIGLAAIIVALSKGCTVFVTVDSEEKKAFIKSSFPELPDMQICDVKNSQLDHDILNATKGKGVKVILNTLANVGLQTSIQCIMTNGRFLDVGDHTYQDKRIGMAVLMKNCTIQGVVFKKLLQSSRKSRDVLKACMNCLREGIESGKVRPIVSRTFSWDQAAKAFQGSHDKCGIGKVVLKIRDENAANVPTLEPKLFSSVGRVNLHPEKCHVVVGVLALEICQWLIDRGSRNVVLSTRTDVSTGYARLRLQCWEELGVRVKVFNPRTCSAEDTALLLKEANSLGDVEGIFHVEMGYHNESFMNTSLEQFQSVWSTIANSARNLDKISRESCPNLAYFVLFSSSAFVTGMAGHSQHAYAYSVMTRLIEKRRALGLPGIVIQWGLVGDVGPFYENMGLNDAIIKGTISQRLSSCLSVMERLVLKEHSVVSSFVPLKKDYSTITLMNFRREICDLLGITESDVLTGDLTLGRFTEDHQVLEKIRLLLETSYNVRLPTPLLLKLKIKHLESAILKGDDIQDALRENRSKIPCVIRQPEVAHEVLVHLNSVAPSSKNYKCLFFVHPVDGHVDMLKEIGMSIDCPTYGLQFTSQVPSSRLQDIAANYIEHIKTVQKTGPYCLCGYDFGSLIAYEMALQLQATDQMELLIFLDSSPLMAKESSRKWIGETAEINMSLAPYMMVVNMCLGTVSEEVQDYLKYNIVNTSMSQVTKLNKFILLLGLKVPFETVEAILKLHQKMAEATSRYELSGKVKGSLLIIKSKCFGLKNDVSCINNYGSLLEQYVTGPMEELQLNCTATQLLEDKAESVADIINRRISM